MLRRTLAWAVVAVVSLAILGDPRPGIARAHQTDPIEAPPAIAFAGSTPSVADLLEVPIIDAPATVVEPVATPVVATAPIAPDTSAAVAQAAEPAPAPAAKPAAPAVVAAPPPPPPPAAPVATCPSTWFCYPRLGISGPIVPYSDCSAATDVGTAIRAITCVSPTYLAGHAYTQFGRLTGWRAGDIVFAYGVRYFIIDGFSQGSCAIPARALAPLSLQTSLSSANCGPVLVVQGRPG